MDNYEPTSFSDQRLGYLAAVSTDIEDADALKFSQFDRIPAKQDHHRQNTYLGLNSYKIHTKRVLPHKAKYKD